MDSLTAKFRHDTVDPPDDTAATCRPRSEPRPFVAPAPGPLRGAALGTNSVVSCRRRTALTCDLLVTYFLLVTDDDRVFKALADPTRRLLLDRLFVRDGQTLTELESAVEMTRYGVMKHLRVLEEAGLVVPATVRPGEVALPQPGAHPPDPRPVDRQVHGAPRRGARRPEERAGGTVMTTTETTDTAQGERTLQVHRVYIKADAGEGLAGDHRPGVERPVRLRGAPQYFELRPGGSYRSTRVGGDAQGLRRDGLRHPGRRRRRRGARGRPAAQAGADLPDAHEPAAGRGRASPGSPTRSRGGPGRQPADRHPRRHRRAATWPRRRPVPTRTRVGGGGGGWAWILSDLKSLLETGSILAG